MMFDIEKIIKNQMIDELIKKVIEEFETIDECFDYGKIIGKKKWLDMTIEESDEKVIDPIQDLFDSCKSKTKLKKIIISELEEMKR